MTATATEVKGATIVDTASLRPSHAVIEFERRVDLATARAETSLYPRTEPAVATRWLVARATIIRLVADLLDRWSVPVLLGLEQPPHDQLGGRDVLDGQAHGLEGGDRLGITAVDPVARDRTDLDEIFFRR